MCYVLIDQVGLKKNFLTLFFWFFVLENVPLMTDSVSMLERSNILVLRKELNEKDRNLKIQLLIATKNGEKSLSEKVFLEDGFFKNVKCDFNIFKVDFPEHTLVYINQGQLLIHKGKPIIYNDYFIFSHVITLQYPPSDLDNYVCKESETKMLFLLYNTTNGQFIRIKQILGYIMLRGNKDEQFFTYGFSEENSSTLYSYSKQIMPNGFVGTSFKNHKKEMMVCVIKKIFRKSFSIYPALQITKKP